MPAGHDPYPAGSQPPHPPVPAGHGPYAPGGPVAYPPAPAGLDPYPAGARAAYLPAPTGHGPYPPGPWPPGSAAPPAGAFPSGAAPWPPGTDVPRRTHRWGLGAYVLVEAVFLGASLLIGLVLLTGGSPSAGTLALALGLPTVLAAGTAVLITVVRGNGPRLDLGLHWSWRDVGLGLAFGIGGLFVTIPAAVLYLAIVGDGATAAVGDVFSDIRAGPLMAITVLAIVAFVAPLCEEIVYRGLLWGGVERRWSGRWVPFVVTTLLFAIAHFEFLRTPLLLVAAIPIGLARLYTGRLLASIVAHQVNNLLPGLVLMFGLLGLLPMP